MTGLIEYTRRSIIFSSTADDRRIKRRATPFCISAHLWAHCDSQQSTGRCRAKERRSGISLWCQELDTWVVGRLAGDLGTKRYYHPQMQLVMPSVTSVCLSLSVMCLSWLRSNFWKRWSRYRTYLIHPGVQVNFRIQKVCEAYREGFEGFLEILEFVCRTVYFKEQEP